MKNFRSLKTFLLLYHTLCRSKFSENLDTTFHTDSYRNIGYNSEFRTFRSCGVCESFISLFAHFASHRHR